MSEIENIFHEDILSALLNNPFESITVINDKGVIVFISEACEKYLNISKSEFLGRDIETLFPKTEMLKVLKTGKADIGGVLTVRGEKVVAARIPLKKNGKVIGVLSKTMFRSQAELNLFYERIESLEKKLSFYEDELNQFYRTNYSFSEIIGNSPLVREAKSLGRLAAQKHSPVLITGESGTGKELLAHAIHKAGERSQNNFVRVNCAAIPRDLFESEMFGYEAGSFTGAGKNGKPGKFELADKGTIFLDEVAEMPLEMQVKLLRVLQEKEVERVGGNRPRKIDFRVISATNRDFKQLIHQKLFRQDLYYRLDVLNIRLPSLREIPEDIPLIFRHVVEKIQTDEGQPVLHVASKALKLLQQYHWPGNVRELRNVAERAIILHKNGRIEPSDLPISVLEAAYSSRVGDAYSRNYKFLMDKAERSIIMDALKASGNNRNQAARALGIHRTGLYKKMKKHQMI